MSDQAATVNERSRLGSAADRIPPPAKIADTAAYSYTAGVGLATAHWAIKCHQTGHWVFVPPDDALIEMWLFMVLPMVHLVVRIIMNRLKKLAGE